jgi:chromosome partitioning protein
MVKRKFTRTRREQKSRDGGHDGNADTDPGLPEAPGEHDSSPENHTNNTGVIPSTGVSSRRHEPQLEVEAHDEEARVATTKVRVSPGAPEAELPDTPILDVETLPGSTNVGGTPVPLELPRVIAIANQKGGVGKTTTAVNLGASLAELGFRVLVIDLDPQGNATTGLGLNPRDVSGSIYDVLLQEASFEDCIEPTAIKNLFVAPATIDLAGAEIELVPQISRELKLRKAVNSVRDDYDIMLIDCPPSLGLLTVNGLAAADDVIVPIQCEYYALEGLGQLLRNVGLVQANLNPDLDVRGIVLTMYDARTKLADQVEAEVRNYFGAKVYKTIVPRTVRLSEAPSYGQPIIVFDATSRGAKAYRDLAKEVSRGATRRTG